MADNQDDSFNASKAEVFDALGHPTRIKILQTLSEKPLPFSELKRAIGLESNGLLTFHLGKLSGLVRLNSEGAYALTDEGKEALRMIEASRIPHAEPRTLRPSVHLPQQKAVLAALVLILVVLGSVAVYQQGQIATLDKDISSIHDPLAVGFGASLNATTIAENQTVRVYLADWNTLDFTNSPSLSDGLRAQNLSLGLCSGTDPLGIAVYEGVYGLDNVTSATPISFYAPGTYYSCGLSVVTNSFVFQPLQNITAYVDLQGYWTAGETTHPGGGISDGMLHPFLPGVYTVITGDEWGHTKAIYFYVRSTVDTISVNGLSLCPSNCVYPSPYLTGTLTISGTTPLTMLEVYVNSTFDGTPIQNPGIETLTNCTQIGNQTTCSIGTLQENEMTSFVYTYKGSIPSEFIPAVIGDKYAITFVAAFQNGVTISATYVVVAA
jgi:DNA-binding transcriptional ArsR family regulator